LEDYLNSRLNLNFVRFPVSNVASGNMRMIGENSYCKQISDENNSQGMWRGKGSVFVYQRTRKTLTSVAASDVLSSFPLSAFFLDF
jgi:hypothetical protein